MKWNNTVNFTIYHLYQLWIIGFFSLAYNYIVMNNIYFTVKIFASIRTLSISSCPIVFVIKTVFSNFCTKIHFSVNTIAFPTSKFFKYQINVKIQNFSCFVFFYKKVLFVLFDKSKISLFFKNWVLHFPTDNRVLYFYHQNKFVIMALKRLASNALCF